MQRVSAGLVIQPFSINERRSTMAKPFLSELVEIVKQIKIPTDPLSSLKCKHFFSGAAAYVDGKIFMSLSPVGLALKLSEDDCQEMMEMGGTHLLYFPKAPIKKGYVIVPELIRSDKKALENLIRKSMAYARS
jgi:TfoX/Sxy family transcriptional regulator of competence genes